MNGEFKTTADDFVWKFFIAIGIIAFFGYVVCENIRLDRQELKRQQNIIKHCKHISHQSSVAIDRSTRADYRLNEVNCYRCPDTDVIECF